MSKVTCLYCGKDFEVSPYYLRKGRGKYCSKDCYLKSRFGTGKCAVCGKPSEYKYCSDKCREDFWNKNDYALVKKNRYWDKKEALIKVLGGKCSVCGFDDIRALEIHHVNGDTKIIPNKRQYTWQRRFKDWAANEGNLDLLCANCHRIRTWEERNYGRNPVKKRE